MLDMNTLESKLAEIREKKEKTLANLNCLIGAENVLLQLIEENAKNPESEEVTADEKAAD